MKRFREFMTESMSRHCDIYLAKDKNWYMDLASKEHGEYHDCTTYGPFKSYDAAEEYLDNFSNPGMIGDDDSGKRPVPKKSPNGRPVVAPVRNRRW